VLHQKIISELQIGKDLVRNCRGLRNDYVIVRRKGKPQKKVRTNCPEGDVYSGTCWTRGNSSRHLKLIFGNESLFVCLSVCLMNTAISSPLHTASRCIEPTQWCKRADRALIGVIFRLSPTAIQRKYRNLDISITVFRVVTQCILLLRS
jgi:hypothetical protein